MRRVQLARSGRLSGGTASAIIAVAVVGLAGCGQQQSPQASSPSQSASPVPASSSVELDAVGSPLEGSFTDAVGTDVTDVASIATDQGGVPGDTAGLYAAPSGRGDRGRRAGPGRRPGAIRRRAGASCWLPVGGSRA